MCVNVHPKPADVCAVITTFRPDDRFPDRVRIVRGQVGAVVIINDGECGDNIQKLNHWFEGQSNVFLHHNPRNMGVAASLNAGLSIARSRGCQWVLTLDDDSLVRRDMVQRLINWLQSNPFSKPIGIIGMSWVAPGDIGKLKLNGEKRTYRELRGIITSGSFFAMETYDCIGPFRDDFYIDFVDIDYCLRARRKGLAVIRLNEAGFLHIIGNSRVVRVMGIGIVVEDQQPFRVYYGYRNSTVLALEHWKREPLYALAIVLNHVRKFFRIILFEKNKTGKLVHAATGIRDGWKRKLGKVKNPS